MDTLVKVPPKELDVNFYTSCYDVDPWLPRISTGHATQMNKKSMPLLHATTSTANGVYQASLIALLLGAGLVLISAVALIWANSVRDRETAEQLASVDAIRARADAEVAEAKAEVAAANKQVVEAKTEAAHVEKELANAQQGEGPKPVIAGRQVSVENCGLFMNFVKSVAKGRVEVQAISSNPEATQFAKQICDMLKSAGYDAVENLGSTTLLGAQPVGVQMKIRSMDDQPMYAGSLQRGLEFVGIATTGALDAAAGDEVIIFVGSKP